MDWDTPKGVLRRGMSLERNGYRFYSLAAERASDVRGQRTFLDLATQEVDHLHLLLAEYRALDQGRGWLSHEDAMAVELDLDAANPDLPGDEPPDPPRVFTPGREVSLEGDIAALEFAMQAELMSVELYAQGGALTEDANAREAYAFLQRQEEAHYRLLQNTLDYLTANETWWDSEELPFFTG